MFYSLTNHAITSISGGYARNQFSGSSRYTVENQEIKPKNRKQQPITPAYVQWANEPLSQCEDSRGFWKLDLRYKDVAHSHIASDVMGNCETTPEKNYTLNKSKVRKKISAFFLLDSSKKFCAFYTISFPLHLSDNLAYKVFNTWLTRCRKVFNLQSYLWVAERQKNGTIHFHMLTNTFMQISEVNRFMSVALSNLLNKQAFSYDIEAISNYNGVDVDDLFHPKPRDAQGKRIKETREQRRERLRKPLNIKQAQKCLSYYITKYVTKNDVTFNRLPWHCSRDISALFTSELVNEDEFHELTLFVRDHPDQFRVLEFNEVTVYIPLFEVDLSEFNRLKHINNQLVKKFFDKT